MGLHSSAGWGVIWTHMHECILTYRAPLSQPEQGSGPRVGGGGGGLGADTFLLTITSHTGTHIPTSWWPPPPILFPWATSQSPSSPSRSFWICADVGRTQVVNTGLRETQNLFMKMFIETKKICRTLLTLHILEYHEIKTLEFIKFPFLIWFMLTHCISCPLLPSSDIFKLGDEWHDVCSGTRDRLQTKDKMKTTELNDLIVKWSILCMHFIWAWWRLQHILQIITNQWICSKIILLLTVTTITTATNNNTCIFICWLKLRKKRWCIKQAWRSETSAQTSTQTQTSSHLPSCGNEHDVYENHVVWSTPATAAFTVPGGLWAIMSHFSEVKVPSTHDVIKCTNSNSVKSRNYALGISPVLGES